MLGNEKRLHNYAKIHNDLRNYAKKIAQITITGTCTVTELRRKLGAITELRRKKTRLRNYAKVFSRLKIHSEFSTSKQ